MGDGPQKLNVLVGDGLGSIQAPDLGLGYILGIVLVDRELGLGYILGIVRVDREMAQLLV